MTRKNELHARLSGVYILTGQLKCRYQRASEVQNSIALGSAYDAASTAGKKANALIERFHRAPTDPAELESFLDEAEAAAGEIEASLDQVPSPCIRGLAPADCRVTHRCVTAEGAIHSSHDNKSDALYNSLIIGGRCLPASEVPFTPGPGMYHPGDERNMDDREEDGPSFRLPTPEEREGRRLAAEYC